jgi:hypothetical protein
MDGGGLPYTLLSGAADRPDIHAEQTAHRLPRPGRTSLLVANTRPPALLQRQPAWNTTKNGRY